MGELDAWNHCPSCGNRVDVSDGRVECGTCGFITYATSKPTASAVIVDEDGRVMLSRRARDPAAGKWDLPGGFLEEGEHPLDALHRELDEEAGVRLRDTEFLGIFMDWYGEAGRSVATLNLYYTARIAAGTPEPRDDVEEFRFFSVDAIPAAELAFDHLPEVFSALRQQHA